MKTSIAHASNRSVISLDGRFDMDSHIHFRNAYRKLLSEIECKEMVVDLSAVDYLDSSALGSLLLLREETERRSIVVKLAGCRPYIRQILAVAHLDRLFAVSAAA